MISHVLTSHEIGGQLGPITLFAQGPSSMLDWPCMAGVMLSDY